MEGLYTLIFIFFIGCLSGLFLGFMASDIPLQQPVNKTTAAIRIPAVDQSGRGVISEIVVSAMPGSGRVLTDIDSVVLWTDTQDSIRTARTAAGRFMKSDMDRYDLVYSIKTDAGLVEGPSAGAALTLATIAAVEGIKLKPDVMITGSIDGEGNIVEATGVAEKAKAAGDAGAVMLLVPEKGSVCDAETVCTDADIEETEKDSGIEIITVRNVMEALEYFRNG
jgi:uncharacterized protein